MMRKAMAGLAALLLAGPAAAQDATLPALMAENRVEVTDLFLADLDPRDPSAGRALEMRVESAIPVEPAALRAGEIDAGKLALFEGLCAEVLMPMAERMNAGTGEGMLAGIRILFDETPGAAIGAASRMRGVTFAVTMEQGCGHFSG
ncbi:hypothetical protein BCF33_0632 [Hasllibacter halocynthiae]|uniref:Uncharacterized protein n=1 Tax=Hasllibacter halocynthiae TaxID=595589 RepID=A0A2T0X7U1_9RHOB|nr:hypothetical protein [Hasllibacter halocynthiae]PRY95020.1 hypothetical protein BCF33_0632 [Hasllibacter halocynthiae]